MPRAVANTLLPAARPASTIARPRPRELPVTNHTCAIHPPVYRSQPLGYSIEASQTQDWMHDRYTNGLVSYGGNHRILRSQGYSLRVRESQRVETALSILEGKWKIVILIQRFTRPIWRFSELERAVP